MPDEPREVRLEVERDGGWVELARSPVLFPGWSAHFRIEAWDDTRDVRYRVRHGAAAEFTGLIRRDPRDKDEIVVANMSCNSSRTTGLRPEIIDHLRAQDPDLLFFAGDQTYRHTEHTAGWLEFGLQFRDVMRDRRTRRCPTFGLVRPYGRGPGAAVYEWLPKPAACMRRPRQAEDKNGFRIFLAYDQDARRL